jgi:hypothetical protein
MPQAWTSPPLTITYNVLCAHRQPLSESRNEKKTLFRHKPEQCFSVLRNLAAQASR